MIPAGYMAKHVLQRPADWPLAPNVVDIYSVSGCLSKDFANYIPLWKHNGFWLFDSPAILKSAANHASVDLAGSRFFYYEVYELQYDIQLREWTGFIPEQSFKTQVARPKHAVLEGYDVVNFTAGTSPECSPLACNSASVNLPVNSHCLLASFDEAKDLLEAGRFNDIEPGPYRIFAVYSLQS